MNWLRRSAATECLLLVLMLTATAAGQVTRDTKEVAPFDLVVLEVDKLPAPAKISVVWSFLDPIDRRFETFETTEDFRCVFVSAASGAKLVVEAAVIDWDARTFAKRVWVVASSGDPPLPPRPPDPPPTPDVPNGWQGLTKLAYDLSTAYKPKPESMKTLGQALRKEAQADRPTVQAYFSAVNLEAHKTTDQDLTAARVMGLLESRLDQLWKEFKLLRTVADAKSALTAIADGLERYGDGK